MKYIALCLAVFTTLLSVGCGGGSSTEGSESSLCETVTCSGHGECAVTAGGEAVCLCDDGYEADGTECKASSACEGVDCSGHGSCVEAADATALCVCDHGYEANGIECVAVEEPSPCDGIDCSGHGVCAVTANDEAICVCDADYERQGTECVEPDPCEAVDCSGHGTCSVQDDQPSCECDTGYLVDGLSCVEDPCHEVDCSGHGTCSVDAGTAVCSCDRGYTDDATACIPAFDYVYEGTFTLTTNGDPTTGAFDSLIGVELEFFVGLDVSMQDTFEAGLDEKSTRYHTDSVMFWMGADALNTEAQAVVDTVIADLNGRSHNIEARRDFGSESVYLNNLAGASAAEYFGFEVSSIMMDLADDSNGFPVLETFADKPTAIKLRRYSNSNGFTMTDYTRGDATVTLW